MVHQKYYYTKHYYISKTLCKKKDKFMILGTIHPDKRERKFILDYFYGNENSLWSILSKAFPNNKYPDIKFDIGKNKYEIVRNIKKTLKNYNIFITDTLIKGKRKNLSANDHDLLDTDKYYNKKQIEKALKKKLKFEKIFFTSEFSFILFKRMFKDELEIKKSSKNKEQNLYCFGRKIKGIILYSPSPASNQSISKMLRINKIKKNVSEYRIEFYRNKFNNIFEK